MVVLIATIESSDLSARMNFLIFQFDAIAAGYRLHRNVSRIASSCFHISPSRGSSDCAKRKAVWLDVPQSEIRTSEFNVMILPWVSQMFRVPLKARAAAPPNVGDAPASSL